MSMKDRKHLDMVKWKDVLDNKWYGPDPERDEPEVQDDGCWDPDGDPDATMAQQTMPHGEDGTLGGDQSLADADANSC
ncbi:hypothetical protein STEG23_031402 [Scotinomys teguina]